MDAEEPKFRAEDVEHDADAGDDGNDDEFDAMRLPSFTSNTGKDSVCGMIKLFSTVMGIAAVLVVLEFAGGMTSSVTVAVGNVS